MLNGKASWLVLMLAAAVITIAQPKAIHVVPEEAETHLLPHSLPKLPTEAQAQHISGGTAGVQVRISATGEVEPVRVIGGNPILTKAAMEEVRSWKYRPFVINGVPEEVVTEVTVEFRSSPPSRVRPYFFAGVMSALVLIAFARGILFDRGDMHWRSRVRLIAVIIVSASWLQLMGEVVYRRVLDLPFDLESTFVRSWIGANLYLCVFAVVLALIGKGRGRVAAFLAAPMLVFCWAIHYAV